MKADQKGDPRCLEGGKGGKEGKWGCNKHLTPQGTVSRQTT